MSKQFITLSLGLLILSACTPAEKEAMEPMINDTETMMQQDDVMMKDDDSDSMMDDESKDAMMDEKMEKDGMKDADMMKKDAMMESSKGPMMDEKMEEDGMKFAYTAFAPSVLTDGRTKVLFFHAAWCPTCRSADADLQTWFAANVATRNVYKVDYDTSAELKAKYGVTYQHTFVLVDGQGNALKTVQGPSDDVLKSMIGAQ